MSKTFDEIAAEQGWNADSREQILKDFIDTGGTDLADYALKRAFEENDLGYEMTDDVPLPDFSMDVTGEYQGNAYPEKAEYRIVIPAVMVSDAVMLRVEDSSGNVVGTMEIGAEMAEGIRWMAGTNHDLSGYEDDWTLPAGMDREIVWTLPTSPEHDVRLDGGQIDEIAAWLRFASGDETYTGDTENWEY